MPQAASAMAAAAPEPELQEIASAMRRWLDENRRMQDQRFIAYDIERLIASGLSAKREEGTQTQTQYRTWRLEFPLRGGSDPVRLRTHYVCRRGAEIGGGALGQGEGAMDAEVEVDLLVALRLPDSEERSAPRRGKRSQAPEAESNLVEFHGRRGACGVVDEAMSWVNFEAFQKLQQELLPALPRPIILLDLLLSLPLAPGGDVGPVPFRACVLEDMLADECWAEGSDEEDWGDEEDDEAAEGELEEQQLHPEGAAAAAIAGAAGAGALAAEESAPFAEVERLRGLRLEDSLASGAAASATLEVGAAGGEAAGEAQSEAPARGRGKRLGAKRTRR